MTELARVGPRGADEQARGEASGRPFPPQRGSSRSRAREIARQLDRLVESVATRTHSAPPGLEWVLDNHFVLRRAMRQVRRGLTREFERRLPTLGNGPDAGLRRVEVEAFETLRESEGLLDRELLTRRAREFGREREGSMAELWALPMLLRLGLLEQLAVDVPRLLGSTTVAEVDHRVANCVRSLLAIEKTDWARFFERVSDVHLVLLGDPSGDYAKMDFATRDRYRRTVETLARGSSESERQVAKRAIELAKPSGHVGRWLIDDGRPTLERAIGHRATVAARSGARLRRRGGLVYLGSIGLIATLHVGLLAALLATAGASVVQLTIACALAVIPAWTIAVNVTNWLISLVVQPLPLPKLEFGDAVPAEYRTLIVVPGLLTRTGDSDALALRLEAHYLATRDPHIEIAMLTDFRDAASESLAGDDALLDYARARIVALNQRYADEGERPFHLFHRKRVWSPRQDRWMGWERKRGKLDELNQLLRGALDTTYVVHEGREGHFAGFRYVLTLDADTILPLGAGVRLIETLAHPLNRARFDADGRVRAGYTVLQPRVDLAPSNAPTRFAQVFAGDGAFDIYSHAVSDVYQDLLGEGIFVGKGIYAIDDFQRSVTGRMPDDRILSHDLLEGVHGRAGLVTDVVVYEDYPTNWLSYARRLHRWVRGDWQLLAWLGRRVPVADGLRQPTRLGAIARYKILDNLRRSLLAPTLIGFAAFGWIWLPGPAWVWTSLILLLLGTPALTELAGGLLRGFRPGGLRRAVSGLVASTPAAMSRWLLRVSVLVHEAAVCLDAIARAIIRTTITRRNQLEWTPAAVAGRGTDRPRTIFREMAIAWLLPPAIGCVLLLARPSALSGALPLLVAWLLAPPLAIWTAHASRPRHIDADLDPARLRRLARRTWGYYETVIGPGDHWLPPDNLQEPPQYAVAHRTSPTNIGMSLLATIAAHDLGHIDLIELVFRLRNTIETIGRMPAHRGHVLNWVDTKTLEPLEPRYVSTVDSGNLAAALVILEQSCREFAVEARPLRRRFVGLADSLDVLQDALSHWGPSAADAAAQVGAIRARVMAATDDPASWSASLDALDDATFAALGDRLLHLFENRSGDETEPARFEDLRTWATRIHAEVAGVRSELDAQLPWVALLARAPVGQTDLVAVLRKQLAEVPTLGETDRVVGLGLEHVERLRAGDQSPAWREWLDALALALRASGEGAALVRSRLEEIAELAANAFAAMDFEFLYDRDRRLTYIGYDVSSERFDDHHYDLLASEARLTSLLGIAKGDIPLGHWAKLGRPIGRFGGGRGLLSWSGTMFEYLLPPLLIDEGSGTLLDTSARAAIEAQIVHARRRGVPWGMSESGYARLDAQHHYQYRAFGVPATGFRRGLDRDLVVAPYASVMALNHHPAAVAKNLDALAAAGAFGPLGLYEALDYTRERVALGRDHEVVRSYMSHHQGMILLAVHGYLCDRPMPRRMHRNPAVRAVELLLHERSPGRVHVERPQPAEQGPSVRPRLASAHGWPASSSVGVDAHVVSNGRLGLLITRAGAGHSWWKGVAITRPCRDPTLEDIGTVTYLRDEDDGHTWSSLGEHGPAREVVFTPHGAVIRVHHRDLVAELTITIAPRDDAELRVLRLSERGGRRRRLTITNYAELVLGSAVEYERHPAFAKLFIASQVVLVDERPILICRRRPRAPDQPESWLACAMISDSPIWSRYETDRDRFVGRARSLVDPAGSTRPLPSATTPMVATLDTCIAMSGRMEVSAGGSRECAFISVYGSSRAEVLERASRLGTMAAIRRNVLDAERVAVARAQSRGHDTDALRSHQRLLSAVLYPRPDLRAGNEFRLAPDLLGQPGLWRHGISGDWPILVVRVTQVGAGMITRLADAHSHWHERGVAIDLVIVEERGSVYDGSLRQRLAQLLEQSGARVAVPGGAVFVLQGAGLAVAERNFLLGCASLVIDAENDLDRSLVPIGAPPLPAFEPEGQSRPTNPALERPRDLQFDNGYGGFSPDGREYVIHVEPGRPTPAPWTNVIANPSFGCLVSERGIGYAWSVNAGLRRLTPWSNDAVLDPPSTSLYLRDELDGQVWSPMPAPAPYPAAYQVRHGAGYTSFTQHGHGLRQRVEVFVAPEDPVALIRLDLINTTDRPRRLTVTLCIEWLLGSRGSDTRTLITDFVPEHQIVLANNSWNPTFAGRWAFAIASERLHGLTNSREEFFGRGGTRRSPAALRRIGLSGEFVPGVDPCAALQVHIDLPPGGEARLHFAFGDATDRNTAIELAQRYRDPAVVDEARSGVDRVWDRLLSTVEVQSPDPGFDLMVNRWLLYQAIASRLWGRTGFSQSSGAFGFRDQLQDVMALTHAAPERMRSHLLDAAGRQFSEGDVLHWWHPPSGQGLRSRCSDDLLWLPLVTAHYVESTGDESVLHEVVAFLDGPTLAPEQHEQYLSEFSSRSTSATLYEHCLRAFERARGVGSHGLPLIGSGDWNDGFSHVGPLGRGESVWLGWFISVTATAFARICDRLGRSDDARELREGVRALVEPLATAWDGEWYLRGHHDDGGTLGAAGSEACQIDSLAQSWAVFAQAPTARTRVAMESVWQQLVLTDERLVRLFAPPFRKAEARVGYVEGYPAGVRENGGQYTHAAVWVAWAFADLGDVDRAWSVFRLIGPLAHGSDAESIANYRIEPYVIAADVYTEPPHVGRGGWSWYTGAAAWSHRLAVERLLGVRRVEGRITLDPLLPSEWPGCRLIIRDGGSVYRVLIEKHGAGRSVVGFSVDGVEQALPAVLPKPDGRDHEVRLRVGRNQPTAKLASQYFDASEPPP